MQKNNSIWRKRQFRRTLRWKHCQQNVCAIDDDLSTRVTSKEDIALDSQHKQTSTSRLAGILSVETKGDVVKLSLVLTVVPLSFYGILLTLHFSEVSAGLLTTGSLSVFILGIWVLSYFSRVANKKMTYAQQLREYEDKVLEKRLDELSESELAALLAEIEEEKKRL
eukprot:jgi/Galph1/4336/GphlegSOOS_G2980.1